MCKRAEAERRASDIRADQRGSGRQGVFRERALPDAPLPFIPLPVPLSHAACTALANTSTRSPVAVPPAPPAHMPALPCEMQGGSGNASDAAKGQGSSEQALCTGSASPRRGAVGVGVRGSGGGSVRGSRCSGNSGREGRSGRCHCGAQLAAWAVGVSAAVGDPGQALCIRVLTDPASREADISVGREIWGDAPAQRL